MAASVSKYRGFGLSYINNLILGCLGSEFFSWVRELRGLLDLAYWEYFQHGIVCASLFRSLVALHTYTRVYLYFFMCDCVLFFLIFCNFAKLFIILNAPF